MKFLGKLYIDRAFQWVYAALFLLLPLWFSFFLENLSVFELNKQVIFKLLLLFLVCLLAIKIIIEKKVFLLNNRWIYWFWLLFLPLLAVNLWLSVDTAQTFFGRYGREQGILSFFHYWLFFGVVLFSWPYIKNKRTVWYSLVLGSVPVLFYGFLQYFGLDPIAWGGDESRLFSSLGQPNFYGYYLVLILPLSVYVTIFLVDHRWLKLFFWLVVLGQIVSLALTYSRGAFLGLLAILFVLLLLYIWRNKGIKNVLLTVLILAIAVGGLLAVRQKIISSIDLESATSSRLLSRVVSILDFNNLTIQSRFVYWSSAVDIWQDAPLVHKLFGFGKSTQNYLYYDKYSKDWVHFEKMSLLPDRSHNIVLDLFLEFGAIGLLVFMLFNGYVVWAVLGYLKQEEKAVDFWKASLLLSVIAGYFVMNLFAFSMTTHFIFFYFLMAVILAKTGSYSKVNTSFNRLSLGLVFVGFVVLYSMIFYLFAVKYYATDIKYTLAKSVYLQSRDCGEAINFSHNYLRNYMYSREFVKEYLVTIDSCLQAGMTKDQLQTIAANVDLFQYMLDGNMHRYELLINYSKVYAKLGYYLDPGYYDIAEEYFRFMIQKNPNFLFAYQDFAQMKIWQKEFDRAIELLQEGLSKAPSVAEISHKAVGKTQIAILHRLLGEAYYHKQSFAQALEHYQRAIELGGVHLRVFKDAADAAYQLEDYELTEYYLKEGMKFNAEMPVWSESLADLYEDLDRPEEASHFQSIYNDLTNKNSE